MLGGKLADPAQIFRLAQRSTTTLGGLRAEPAVIAAAIVRQKAAQHLAT